MVESISHGGLQGLLLQKLAAHYKVELHEARTAILTRQLLMVNLLTDYSKPGNLADLTQLLQTQHRSEMEIANRATEAISRAMEAITASEKIQAEATRLLALFQKVQTTKNA